VLEQALRHSPASQLATARESWGERGEIELDAAVERQIASTHHLPETGDAGPDRQPPALAQRVADSIREQGASFFDELLEATGLLRPQLEEALGRVATAIEASTGNGSNGAVSGGDGILDRESEMIAASGLRGATRLIPRSSILYVQSYGDFVRVVTADGRYLLRHTLNDLERRWERYGFVRVHRQYLVNLTRAVELQPLLGGTAQLTLAGGHTVPIARRHVGELGRRLAI